MPLSKNKRPKKRRPPPSQGRGIPPAKLFLSGTRGLIAFAVAIVGAISALYSLAPRLSAANPEPLDPKDPLAVMVQVSNDGYLRIRDVKMQCVPTQLEFAVPDLSKYVPPPNRTIQATTYIATQLSPAEKAPVWCRTNFGAGLGQLHMGELQVNICFRPYPLIDRVVVRGFRFVAEHASDGSSKWFQRPANEQMWVYMNDGKYRECIGAPPY